MHLLIPFYHRDDKTGYPSPGPRDYNHRDAPHISGKHHWSRIFFLFLKYSPILPPYLPVPFALTGAAADEAFGWFFHVLLPLFPIFSFLFLPGAVIRK